MFIGTAPRPRSKMRHIKTDIPYAWFWHGKPLRKGYEKGEHIVPVQLVPQNTFQKAPHHSSREPSHVKKSIHPQCGCEHHEQRQPSHPPPPSSKASDHQTPCLEYCSCGFIDCETVSPPSVNHGSCSECVKPPPPTVTYHHECVAPTPASSSSGTVTPDEYCQNECVASSSRTVYCLSCLDYHYECQYLAAVPMSSAQQPVEVVHPVQAVSASVPVPGPAPQVQLAQPKCTCRSCTAMPMPTAANRHHGCCQSEDCRLDKYVAPTVSDDTASLGSVDMPRRVKKTEEHCQCGPFIFAVPVGCSGE